MKIHHLNCVAIQSPTGDNAIGHCVLIETAAELILLDAGISSIDLAQPSLHFSKALIQQIGLNLTEIRSAKEQILALGLDPNCVTTVVLTHLDFDHSSGLLDFPQATVHIGVEELASFVQGNPRYLSFVLEHQPKIEVYAASPEHWLGFEARYLSIHSDLKMALIPLFGHTIGHCGITFEVDKQVYFYIGDAYYLRAELTDPHHPVHELTATRAVNNTQRIETLNRLMTFVKDHPEVCVFGYHDAAEFDDELGAF
ncbi:MBL fold metallo-hydrolase [Myroides sp. 1354]|uniref:MBL fold metallo-hydrolase n=1 Tax=unclassified Myroides TaxID=2642485 RepID=UPI00257871A7|nr:MULTISPECIES: MBL fold metallo-hydrolase [unclassified Myroides]MDM1044961.1 MBL fold metallo-hydrolase [Myroides sp. R163-1]MDM1055674.1 MBL fold metallo-hydrolase [Myroides sp. 1354]MDM1068971.1 MBL fold metallo-hydrolase [Myroides sp. 1372]